MATTDSLKPERNQGYFYQLDAIRAIACIAVLLFHSELVFNLTQVGIYTFSGGFLGVDLFFVLSGFLITNVLLREFYARKDIGIKKFYIKRLLRLYPPILLAALVFLVPLLFYDMRSSISNLFFLLTYTTDCVMFFQHFIKYLVYPLIFAHTWTLAIEEQYYFIFPALFLFLFKRFSRAGRVKNIIDYFPVFNIVLIFLIFLSGYFLSNWYYKFFLWRFFQIFFGAFLALIFSELYQKQFMPGAYTRKVIGLAQSFITHKMTLIAAVLFFVICINRAAITDRIMIFPGYYLFTVAAGVLIINAANEKFSWYNSVLSARWLRYIGKMSYGIYLYHYPIHYYLKNNFFISHNNKDWMHALQSDALFLGLTFIIAALSYEFMEKPILAYKTKLVSASLYAPAV